MVTLFQIGISLLIVGILINLAVELGKEGSPYRSDWPSWAEEAGKLGFFTIVVSCFVLAGSDILFVWSL